MHHRIHLHLYRALLKTTFPSCYPELPIKCQTLHNVFGIAILQVSDFPDFNILLRPGNSKVKKLKINAFTK